MQICYIGDPPAHFLECGWATPPRAARDMELFDVDGVFVFGTRPLNSAEAASCQLGERSGRPVVRVGAVNVPLHRPSMSNVLMIRTFDTEEREHFENWFTTRPRTNYAAIDCALYDRLEAAILAAKEVKLTYRKTNGDSTSLETRLLNTKTYRSEEFVEIKGHGWIRLDRIQSLDGEYLKQTCTF